MKRREQQREKQETENGDNESKAEKQSHLEMKLL